MNYTPIAIFRYMIFIFLPLLLSVILYYMFYVVFVEGMNSWVACESLTQLFILLRFQMDEDEYLNMNLPHTLIMF